jgi:hypothetical protein
VRLGQDATIVRSRHSGHSGSRPLKLIVKSRMRLICLIAALLLPQLASAKDCGEPNWTTTIPLRVTVVTLRWTGVYEAPDAVCELSYPGTGGGTVALQVWGQPIPNAAENLIAFLSCADDGCDKTLVVADVAGGIVMTVPLPLNQPQIHLKAKWDGNTRRLAIADEKAEAVPLLMCAVTHTIACTSTKPNQRLERP